MTIASRRIIGVLGGMGPLAGAWFMQRLVALTPAERDQHHVPAILINDSHIPDRVGPILRGEGESPLPGMTSGIRRLEAAGATMVAIACNTAHYWHGELQHATQLPVLNMIDAAAEEIAGQLPGGGVGVLATRGTLAAGLYGKALAARGLAEQQPTDAIQDHLVLPAIAAIKRGDVAAGRALTERAAGAMRDSGAAGLVIACTELSMAWPADEWPAAFAATTVDAGDALARAALAAARG